MLHCFFYLISGPLSFFKSPVGKVINFPRYRQFSSFFYIYRIFALKLNCRMETEKSMRNERWAVVTGASSGIGFAIARRLAMRGYNIFAAAKDVERLDECARKLSGKCGIRVRTYAADLALPDAAECLFAACQEAGIRAEVLVNDAGVFIYNDIIETDQKRIDGIICLHIRTVTALCRLFAEEMAAAGGGYILNMASYSMWMPLPGIALYSATKAYVKTFSVAFAKEARERNVWVTAVSPAGVATDFYGLSHRLQKVGLAIGVLMTPDKVARKALRALFRHRKHLIPGWYNRLFIPMFKCMPAPCVRLVRNKTACFRQ